MTVCSFFYEFEMKAGTKEEDMEVGESKAAVGSRGSSDHVLAYFRGERMPPLGASCRGHFSKLLVMRTAGSQWKTPSMRGYCCSSPFMVQEQQPVDAALATVCPTLRLDPCSTPVSGNEEKTSVIPEGRKPPACSSRR